MENKEKDYKAMQLRNEPYKAIARRYETGKIGFYDAMHEAFNLPKPAPAVDELSLDKRFYSEQEVKLIATRFARQSRNMNDVTSNDTITSYENWFKPENFKHIDSTHHNHASFVALVEGENTHVQDLYAENKKLANLLKFILDIDAMTTMEFCNAYRKDHPTYKGIVDLAVMEMFAVDSNKWHLVKDRAKEIRKWLTEFENKIK